MKLMNRGLMNYHIVNLIAIASALCLTTVGDTFARYETKALVSAADIAQFLGTNQSKLVYVNKSGPGNTGNIIEYVDFAESSTSLVIHQITGTTTPLVPVISPDGRWVVFASSTSTGEAGAGIGKKSSMYLCELRTGAVPVLLYADSAFEPRFVMNPASDRMTVVFPTQAPDLAWEGKGRTMTLEIDTSGGIPKPGVAREFFTYGSYTGGLSYDNRYLCGGGGLVAMIDATSGKTHADTIGPIGYGTADAFAGQACNASITSSRTTTDRVMFLDFGSGRKTFANVNGGKSWGMWQVLFIGNSNKKLVCSYAVPSNDSQNPYEIPNPTDQNSLDWSSIRWHHPEWSNHPYFAAATINLRRLWGQDAGGSWQETDKQERIALIDLQHTGKTLQILGPGPSELVFNMLTNTNGLYNPWLWVKVPAGFIEVPVLSARHSRTSGRGEIVFGNGVRVRNGLFIAGSQKIASVKVYSLDGASMVAKSFAQGTAVDKADGLQSGAYLAHIVTLDGKASEMRFSIVK